MNVKLDPQLGHVQKTLFLPLWGRAVETRKPKPRLVDKTAVQIIEQVDYDFTPLAQNMDPLSQLAWIRRSQIGDQVIGRFLDAHPDGAVVNLGCGLDTTCDRIDNGQLSWYDLDLPDVIALRRQFIPETARRTFIAASLLDPAWPDCLRPHRDLFFLAAGVLYYFTEPEVKGLFLRLLEVFPGSQILFDVSSPTGVRVANKKVIESAGLDEKSYLIWGVENKKELLTWDPRLKLLGAHYYYRTWGLGLRNQLMGALSDYLGIQYMLHLQLGERA